MAKRSDFAQKLLDDLLLRKERMAAAQSSNHSNTTAIDACTYSKQTYRGSRRTKTSVTASSGTGNTYSRPVGGNKVLDASKHIVPFQKGHSSAQTGDLSMALAFALENGEKLRRMDSSGSNSMLNFLQQIGKGAVELGRLERRSTIDRHQASTTFSHLHIKEISEGAQKLNQILKACSNGHKLDRYSVEVGKELLRGAIDLEESILRLVSMQEASQYMVSSQRKSRITLLEDDDDDDIDKDTAITTEQKQFDLPIFSIDKPSRKSHSIQEVARSGVMQRLAALAYPKGASDSNNEKQALITSNSVSHVRRASHGSDFKTLGPFTGQKDRSSSSKLEKGKISSVIAKLMGLDELPENIDPKYTTQKKISSTRVAEKKNIDSQNMAQQPVKQTAMHAHKRPVLEDAAVDVQAQKQHSNISLLNLNVGRQKDVTEKDRKHDNTKQRKLKGIKSKTKESVIKDELQQITVHKQKRPEAAVIMREHKAGRLHIQNKQKPQSHFGINKPYLLQKIEPQEGKHQVEGKDQQRAKQKIQVSKQKGNEIMSKILSKPNHDAINMQKKQQHMNLVKPILKGPRESTNPMPSKWFPDRRYHEGFGRKGSSINLHVSMKGSIKRNLNQNSSMKFLESEPDGAPPFLEEKVVHVPVKRKVKNGEMHKRNGSLNSMTEPLIQHEKVGGSREAEQVRGSKTEETEQVRGSKTEETEQVRGSKTEEAEARISKSNGSEVSIQPINKVQQLHRDNEKASVLYGPRGDECLRIREQQTLAASDSSQWISPIAATDQKGQAHISGGENNKFDEIVSITGTRGGKDISCPSELKPKDIFKQAIQEPLTEREKHLKQILMKSQLFLDTAQGLLKLSLAFVIINAGGHDCLDEDDKLLLDCGYEITQRKGARQEISVHPYAKISFTSKKITTLDDLVKQLDKDFEVLKLYGRNGKKDCKPEEYLPKIIGSDVHDRYPDVNCMWDASWDAKMLAFLEKDDVIKELERQLLNGLVSEIFLDLLHI